MSDAAITTLAAAAVQIVVLIIGLLTLWIKVKYGADRANDAAKKADEVEQKVDENTAISTLAKDSAAKAEHQTNGALSKFRDTVADHGNRLTSLEKQTASLQTLVEVLTKNIDSTRHEMRGHLQTITSKLDLMALTKIPAEPK